MYVPNRVPSAHQVAAAQDKSFEGCYVYVESGCDCRFWKNHLNINIVKLRACNGYEKVIDSVSKGKDNNQICIGIIDRDFREYVSNYRSTPENVFISDQHDVEMMIIKAEGIDRILNDFDAADHVKEFVKKEKATVLEMVFRITNRIGLLKMIDRRDRLDFKLRKAGKDSEFDLPHYEKFLDREGHYTTDEKMIDYLIGWSRDNRKVPTRSRDEILSLFRAEDISKYDTYQLSCGHDVTYMIAYFIWKQISKEKTDKEEIEKLLRVSYTHENFKQTAICDSLTKWGSYEGLNIIK